MRRANGSLLEDTDDAAMRCGRSREDTIDKKAVSRDRLTLRPETMRRRRTREGVSTLATEGPSTPATGQLTSSTCLPNAE
jgi:hypothetical protein